MIYAFGDYELDSRLYELRSAGNLLKIEPQVFNVLVYLIQHRDHTVTRQELFEQLWPEQYMSDAVLSYCIMAARKAVGDSGRVQRIIKTVHGRGFRFVATLEERGHEVPGVERLMVSETLRRTERPQRNQAWSDMAPGAAASFIPDGAPGAAPALVTVLCATIARATTRIEQPGFDDLQRLRQAFFALAHHLAQQYQGTLRFFGADGILVLFGMAEACEEPARRAVLAAMELQRHLQALGTDLQVLSSTASAARIGLHTGSVPGDNLTDEQQITATAMGDTLHLAVWLQYLTEPGTLLISEATMRLLQGEVRGTAPRDIHVPGQPYPFKTYTVRASAL